MKTKSINFKKENRNSQLTYISTIIVSLFNIMFGLFIVKMTIMMYGEPINGVIRFMTQIFSYIFIIINSLSMAFSIKLIQYYREGNWDKIIWVNRYVKRIFNYFTLIYLIIICVSGIVVSKILSSSSISMWFIYAAFFAMGFQSLTNLFAFRRYYLFYSSINKGYVANCVMVFCKSIFFVYFIIVIIIYPPKLETIINPTDGTPVSTFVNGDTRIYNIVIGLFLFSIYPLVAGFILSFKYKKDKKYYENMKVQNTHITQKEKQDFKSNVWKSIRFTIILSIVGLITTSTDEFVILMLKNGSNDNYILKLISVYGLYSSMMFSIFTILNNYVNTKKTMLGLTKKDSIARLEYIQKIRIRTYWIALLGFLISVLLVPILINFLFNPTSSVNLYLNINFSLPIALLSTLGLLYAPHYLMLEIDNKFHYLAIFSSIEAIINLILSISLIRILGVYWVIWSSIIAFIIKYACTKIVIFKIYGKNISKFPLLNKNELILIIVLLTISIGEIIMGYTINIPLIILYLKHHYLLLIVFSELIITSLLILFLTLKHHKKLSWIKFPEILK